MEKSILNKSGYVSVRSKILVSLLVVSLLLVFTTVGVSYQLSTAQVNDISMKLTEQNIATVGKDLSETIGEYCNSSVELVHLDSLRAIAEMEHPDENEQRFKNYSKDVYRVLTDLTVQPSAGVGGFDFAGVYLTNGYVSENLNNARLPFADYDECLAYFSALDPDIIEGEYTSARWELCTVGAGKERALVYVRFIYEPSTMRKIGLAVFGISVKRIEKDYVGYLPQSFILSKQGIVLSADNREMIGVPHPYAVQILGGKVTDSGYSRVEYTDTSGKKIVVFLYSLQNINAFLVIPHIFYKTIRNNAMLNYIRSMSIMGVFVILFVILIAIVISRGLSRSAASLVNFTRSVERGNRELRYVPTSRDEIAFLGTQINLMLDEIYEAEQQREDDLKIKQTMELKLLQQQINPHLLYNTLDSLLWYLQQEKNEDAVALTNALSQFFKISLSHGREKIALQKELQLIGHYLVIQKIARNKDITLTCDIDDALTQYPIFKLTLQPLVENAIIHGFSGYRDDGSVKISAKRSGDVVMIQVTDDGIGITEEDVERINQIMTEVTRPKEFGHFGLYNVNQRIVREYGPEYGIRVESQVCAYTTIHIRIPYLSLGEQEETAL